MRKLIKSIGINEKRGEALREKAIELLIKSQRPIKEVDIVNYLIDEVSSRVDIDEFGFYLIDDDKNTHQ
ncbi:MAG: hypothetical protein D8H97_10370 [Neisseria sp.]|uniref:hypothetical protein n=1 Tax=Neisseria cinerea TaxID=483 RepID=UPI000F1408DF|nr:hypothetical protein [Neisseria cinerea]RKV82325.1 MAG: hypothetical protein D8H97_10370 [Neisseria sp.]DAS84624.1 MAG TPA: hypothetical protein [Inoviridae sp.]